MPIPQVTEFTSYYFTQAELDLAMTLSPLTIMYLVTLRSAEALQKLEVLSGDKADEHRAYLQGKIDAFGHLINLQAELDTPT